MTTAQDINTLTNFDVVVLARLSASKSTSPSDIRKSLIKIMSPPDAANANLVSASLLRLHRARFANENRRTPEGEQALRSTFGLDSTPEWKEVRVAHLPALGLGLRAGSQEAAAVLADGKTLSAHLVCKHIKVATPTTLKAVSDALIIKALELPPGDITLERIRAHMLARQVPKGVITDNPTTMAQVAARVVHHVLGEPAKDKNEMVSKLSRQWIYVAQKTITAPPADALLNLVRETIPRIGSDGRFGTEKVFVSAIWQRIERDHRFPDLSLDRFKRWLVTANREQLVDLARADLVGAMDPKLVKESEIHDLGATFHFVVDRRVNGTERGHGHHAR